MAYDWAQEDVQVALGADISSTGIEGRLVAGRYGFILRGAAVVIETAVADAATITIQRRPVAGAAANQVTVDTIEIATTHEAGEVVYLDGLNTKISPGEDLVFDVTGAGASGVASITATIERLRDAAGNDTSLVATT